MLRARILYKWLQIVLCGAVVGVLLQDTAAVDAQPTAHSQVRLMFMFQGNGQEGSQTVENTLIRAFLSYGFNVFDAETVGQTLRRNADLLRLYEVEAAKRLGARLGADIVISGTAKTRVVDKTYDMLGGKRVTVSQADVSAKAIMVRSGKVLVAENAHARKPFDNTSAVALQAAAEAMADKLRQGIEQFLSRDTVDYRLSLLNISPQQSVALQNSIRQRVPGVRQVRVPGVQQRSEERLGQNTLELEVNVDRQQDMAFKGNVSAQLASLGLGRFETAAREEETIYLRRVGEGSSPTPPPPTKYQPGYRKSWAVVIGINAYQKWPKLEYAVNDAKAIGELLKGKFGFNEIIMLLDGEATQKNILRVLGDDLKDKTQAEDRVFIFFAGHGQTEARANGSNMGYIIPVEGEMNNYYSSAISMDQLREISNRLHAKHIFYAMDSCFSGLLRLRGFSDKQDCHTCFKARQFLTAGSGGERVTEVQGHGLFTKVLIDALQGAANRNQNKRVTATELYEFLNPRVLEESRNTQNPVFGQIEMGSGEFEF